MVTSYLSFGVRVSSKGQTLSRNHGPTWRMDALFHRKLDFQSGIFFFKDQDVSSEQLYSLSIFHLVILATHLGVLS